MNIEGEIRKLQERVSNLEQLGLQPKENKVDELIKLIKDLLDSKKIVIKR